jgi:hypothetical protein
MRASLTPPQMMMMMMMMMMMLRVMFGFEPSDPGTLIGKPSVQLSFDFDG